MNKMSKKRSYKQQCALARALDMVGDRWTFLLIRELIIAPKRYKTLLDNLKGMGTNLLATRLKELEDSGVIERTAIVDSKVLAYQLTDFGRELEAPILAIIRWGFKLPIHDEDDYLSVDEWDLVAMKAVFNSPLATGISALVAFRCDELRFWLAIDEQTIDITLHEPRHCELMVQASMATLMTIGFKRITIDQAIAQHQLVIAGDRRQIEQVLGCFKMG